jgi:hypothetical protein
MTTSSRRTLRLRMIMSYSRTTARWWERRHQNPSLKVATIRFLHLGLSGNALLPSRLGLRRLEDLDEKLEGFWSKLSVEQNTVDSLMQEQAQFSLSVSRLERDLDQSALRHSCLLSRAGAVKRLFH